MLNAKERHVKDGVHNCEHKAYMEVKTSKTYNVVGDIDIVSTRVINLFSVVFGCGENVAEAEESFLALSHAFSFVCVFLKHMQWVINPLSTVKLGAKE